MLSPSPSLLATRFTTTSVLWAKRNRRQRDYGESDNRWYEDVEADATPDDVFWEEMERQRLLSMYESNPNSNPLDDLTSSNRMKWGSDSSVGNAYATATSNSPSLAETSALLGKINAAEAASGKVINPKTIEATLSEYAAYVVKDNWLDDELAAMMNDKDNLFSLGDSKSLDDQLNDWESEGSDDEDAENAWMSSDEPWDHWGEEQKQIANTDDEPNRVKVDPNNKAIEFLFDGNQGKTKQEQAEERAFLERLSRLKIASRRLDKARVSSKAKIFFSRPPDELEGYDRLWVSAIDNVCFKNLVGTFRNYGIQFADNFGDFRDGCMEDSVNFSIEDIASFKARKVFEVTGLPCIASRTSFEVEPVPDFKNSGATLSRASLVAQSPRVVSGYRFNDVGVHVDYICEALRSVSEPTRVTRFKTCLCYYDGEMEVFDYGICDVDLTFANSLRTFVPVSMAINEMLKTLQLTFGLEYLTWHKSRADESRRGAVRSVSFKLRDRVLKEGRVLPNDIVDVSMFMDSMVDVNLMDECAEELSERFLDQKPNKILTVATTGLVIALPMAKYLQVPVVYARKERNVVMANTYIAAYSSKTVGKNRELLVAKSHLHPDDRVLIIDDFLSSGSSQEALLRIVSDSGASVVGIGVLLEKVYDSGRQSLSGFNVPIHSLCRIASVKDGVIQLVEEEGFEGM